MREARVDVSVRREVVVVGAGPAGSTAAALLAERGHKVLLLDRARFPRPKPCAEYASPASERLLNRLGVLGASNPVPVRRLRGMELIAPRGGRVLVEYCLDDRSWSALALPRLELDTALLEAARKRGAETWQAFRVESAALASGAPVLTGHDSSGRSVRLEARLVLGADGLHSAVARGLAERRQAWWPRSLGLVAHFGGVRWPEDYGRMFVGRRGYVGAAPTGDGTLVVGLVMPMPAGRLGPPEQAFRRGLAAYPELQRRVLGAAPLGPVRGVGPLAYSVRPTAGSGYLLVGDAAGFFDPFTGEGLYRALRGAELAAEVADEALRADDLSAIRLGKYQVLRRGEFQAKERLTWLVQLFVQVPGLMDYVVDRLRRRPDVARQLSLALGDLASAESALRPRALWALLKP
jgi:geranylgeranyl reductase family protein